LNLLGRSDESPLAIHTEHFVASITYASIDFQPQQTEARCAIHDSGNPKLSCDKPLGTLCGTASSWLVDME
jgi:hypothetical protein